MPILYVSNPSRRETTNHENMRTGYLRCALSAYFHCGQPLSITLPLLEEMRLGIPKMRGIWEHSSLAMETNNNWYWPYLAFEEQVNAGLDDGTLTFDVPALPKQEEMDPL